MFIATYGKVTIGIVVGIIVLAIPMLVGGAGAAIPIQIDSPANNSSFLQGEMIMFSGNASGGIAPYNYSWTSNIDGFIGKASTSYNPSWEGNRTHIFTFYLSPGIHKITMTVNDSSGLTNSTSTNITINPASTTTISGQSATGAMTWNASNFPALTTETLTVSSLTGGIGGRTITGNGLNYSTTNQLVPYKVYSATGMTVDYGGGYYAKVGWFGKTYVALKGKANKMAKLILEQNETENKTLLVGETWDMGDGYTLKLNSIDSGALPWQAEVILNKSGAQLGYKVAQNFTVYTYVASSIGGESDVPMFVTYFDNISTNSVRLKYTWLISDNIMEPKTSDIFGLLEVTTASSNVMILKNKYAFDLLQASTINIADGLRFRVNNTSELQYYPEMAVIMEQPSGTPVESSTGKGTVIVNADTGTVENLTAVNVSDIPEPPPVDANLYYGLFRFNITGLSPGGSANVTLTFPNNLPAGTIYWKYGANATNTTPHWYAIPSTIDGNELTIMLTDGGVGDDDLTANGNIRDDGGPGIPPSRGNKSWRFVSVPFKLDNSSVDNVLQGIDYDQLFAFDPVGKTLITPVMNLEPLNGYLIHMDTLQTINHLVEKSGPYVPPTKVVYKGWNLIGTPGNMSLDTETMLKPIDDSYFSIWNWNVANQVYDKVGINGKNGTLTPSVEGTNIFTMTQFKAYWVWVTKDNILPAFSP